MEQRPRGMWKGLSGRHLEEGVQAKWWKGHRLSVWLNQREQEDQTFRD